MSKVSESRRYAASEERIRQACAAVAPGLGWRAAGEPLIWKEPIFGKRLLSLRGGFGNRATMRIAVAPDAGSVTVTYDCSNFGFGPVQESYVRNRLQVFAAAVEGELGVVES